MREWQLKAYNNFTRFNTKNELVFLTLYNLTKTLLSLYLQAFKLLRFHALLQILYDLQQFVFYFCCYFVSKKFIIAFEQ